MRIKAQGNQAKRPQGCPELHLSQPFCQKGREMEGSARFRSNMSWLPGGSIVQTRVTEAFSSSIRSPEK